MEKYSYQGAELDSFELAENWKSYWIRLIRPFLGDSILEVGAGIGANTMRLASIPGLRITCLEPDHALVKRLQKKIEDNRLESRVTASAGYVKDLVATEAFDSILYIDVLEHIKDERRELQDAVSLLKPKGRLIILSPAHMFLYSNFDQAIGHYRRYTRQTLQQAVPRGMRTSSLHYLDSVGFLASAANRILLKQAAPSLKQVLTWDRWFVPLSLRLDPILGYRAGKSVLGVWQKP